MDSEFSLQDVIRCHLCETLGSHLRCDICHIYLCQTCVGEHLYDETTQHKVVPFRKRESSANYPKCPNHSTKQCERYCEQCEVPVCLTCASCKEHSGHKFFDIRTTIEKMTKIIQKYIQELENSIYPKYQDIADYIRVQKADLKKNSQKGITAIDKHGEDLHREINAIVKKMKSNFHQMDSKHLLLLNKQENEITHTISEIRQKVTDLKKLVESNDVRVIIAYKSKNEEFKSVPKKLTVPVFTPSKIDEEQLYQQFGSLSPSCYETENQLQIYTRYSPDADSSQPDRPQIDKLSNKSDEHGYTMGLARLSAESSFLHGSFIDLPRIITYINIEYGDTNRLCGVSCLNNEEVWTRCDDNTMRLYNLKGELVKSVQTKSGNKPKDITVTKRGDLVYTDRHDRSINIVKNTEIQTIIRLRGWKPLNVCSTSSGDLLVIMYSDDCKQTKVVRYSGFTEKQSIQYDDKGQPLYSESGIHSNPKYICENRNLDICVSDNTAESIVVVNIAGLHRFTYTGPPSTPKGSFKPHGINTDSQSRILIAEHLSCRIYILNQDGHFLRFIGNCHLRRPCGLCVDTKDNLFVAEKKRIVKKIQYYS